MNTKQLLRVIKDTISRNNLISIDASDLDFVLRNGYMAVSVGKATGDSRVIDALKNALGSSSLDIGLSEARAMIVHLLADSEVSLEEITKLSTEIKKATNLYCHFIFGIAIAPNYKNKAKVTIIAS